MVYCIYNTFIKIQQKNMRWRIIKNFFLSEMHNAKTYCISVSDEYHIAILERSRNKFSLNNHVANLHVNLIEFAQWDGTILNYIRNRIQGISEIQAHIFLISVYLNESA